MKIRKGFVSNSSTTSFTCEICGNSESGWDSVGITDFGFFQCENGHVLCLEHKLDVDLTTEEMRAILLREIGQSLNQAELDELRTCDADVLEDWWADQGYNNYEMPEIFCPVCQFLGLSSEDAAKFLLKETGVSWDDAFAFVKATNKRRKKLYPTEYVMYVTMTLNKDISGLPMELKQRFGTYRKFKEWLREK